ncbi:MAG: alpha/beta fold hydrolase [Oscillospiraceae bacterium]
MRKIHGRFKSTSGLCYIHYYFYLPDKPKAAVIFSHGMCEYLERYKEFAEYLCENDIAFCGCDHLGHGSSVADSSLRGYFGHRGGPSALVRDLHRMKLIAQSKLPDIPHFLIGHSMGSFIARIYLAKYRDRLNGAVLMGTSGYLPWLGTMQAHLASASKRFGDTLRYDSGMNFALSVFNMRNQNHRTRYDWLSRDDGNVDRFIADPKCNFCFTISGCRDLIALMSMCNSRAVIENTRTDVPVLLLSGGMDPIGEYGAGVRWVKRRLLKQGCDAMLRIYREARHELLFELNRAEIREDILTYLINRI